MQCPKCPKYFRLTLSRWMYILDPNCIIKQTLNSVEDKSAIPVTEHVLVIFCFWSVSISNTDVCPSFSQYFYRMEKTLRL